MSACWRLPFSFAAIQVLSSGGVLGACCHACYRYCWLPMVVQWRPLAGMREAHRRPAAHLPPLLPADGWLG
eukprot:8233098-Pyramimonas_sp.AAC.1